MLFRSEGALRIPVVAANDARSKSLFDNMHGTGQSVVFAVADVADRSFRGATVAVVGFGRVGTGIAQHAAALQREVAQLERVHAWVGVAHEPGAARACRDPGPATRAPALPP